MSNKKTIVFLLIILALAAFFRFWQLNQIPPGLYPDVAMNGTDAIDAMESGDYRMFYPDNNGREGFFMNLIALNFKYFGVSILNIKIVAAIFGWLTILGMFLLTRELFSRLKSLNKANLLALLVAFFMAVSFWHVNFSRVGFRAIMLPLIMVWGFYFLWVFGGSDSYKNIFSFGRFFFFIFSILIYINFSNQLFFKVITKNF